MDTRKVASEIRLTGWAQALRERVSNGESINDFCQSRGVSRNTYFYWQRKLRKTGCEELLVPTQSGITAVNNNLVPSGWASCEVVKPASGSTMTIEINGYRVHVNGGIDSDNLSTVCRVLKSL